ncbi:MAG: L-serine ammonia-lyase [Candidatus Melainabacteria bacterium]|nr:MAG: L-serine ammonia-lyase [Candidatus Melainabacteria bacterium]
MNPTRADQIGPLEMFKIGVGPSSSHTVGPMLAALRFRDEMLEFLAKKGTEKENLSLTVELFGSLSATGRGHMTDGAISAGLTGLHPKTADPDEIWQAIPKLKKEKLIHVGDRVVVFDPDNDLKWGGFTMGDKPLPHPNTIRFSLLRKDKPVLSTVMVSIGGGFIESVDPDTGMRRAPDLASIKQLPYPYDSAAEFIEVCEKSSLTPWQIVIENQKAKGISEEELRKGLNDVLKTFDACIERGLKADGILPGGLKVRRRAKELYKQLKQGKRKPALGGDLRPSVYAMAVNEENAAGGRVVTAPTNGSSGLIPAVWRTLKETNKLSKKTMENGLIVASVIGALVKTHASISGAEVGCQGEVGTSCAMAAAGAVAMLGGSVRQMEQAAEIGIEHHLGMTCDPIQGLVQIPCIERNAMGAVKALNAVYLSLASDGRHIVSLDKALAVMKQTGLDMNQQYKETATGGLALG